MSWQIKSFRLYRRKTKELIGAPTCCDEAKAAAQAWLDAVGTENQAAETERYFAELEEDIMPIENLIAFSDSDAGREYFGAEAAADIAAHAKEIQKNGAKYCDCPACAAIEAIFEKKRGNLTFEVFLSKL